MTLYVIGFAVLLPLCLWQAGRWLDHRLQLAASPSASGSVLLLLGLAGMAWSMVELWRHGGGLPISALPPRQLALGGPYRVVRHPIYLAFNLALFGAGLAFASPGVAFVVAPLFLPAWLVYARAEERGLLRRFGRSYRRYCRRVGVLPRLEPARLVQVLAKGGAFGVRVRGPGRLPERGPFVVVCNHCSLLDSVYCYGLAPLPVRFLATAEAFRNPLARWPLVKLGAVPVRRYCAQPGACRELVVSLEEGVVVGIAPEGERSPWGDYQGARPEVAQMLSQLGVPVFPVGLSGNYDCGPRWSGVLRRRAVTARVGAAVDWRGREPKAALDEALVALLDADPQPLHLDGLPLERLERILWRCPRCGNEPGWDAPQLCCSACAVRYAPTPDGWLRDEAGRSLSLGSLGRRLKSLPEKNSLRAPAAAAHESRTNGPIRSLQPIGDVLLHAASDGLTFEGRKLPLAGMRSITTEGANTLQVAMAREMWQFRIRRGSAFRLQLALERWRLESPLAAAAPSSDSHSAWTDA